MKYLAMILIMTVSIFVQAQTVYKVASAQSNNVLWSPYYAIDGSWPTSYSANAYSSNQFSTYYNNNGTYLAVNIGSLQSVQTIKLHARYWSGAPSLPEAFPKSYYIYHTPDNVNWYYDMNATVQPDATGVATVTLPSAVKTYGIRIVPVNLGTDYYGHYYFQIAEVTLLGPGSTTPSATPTPIPQALPVINSFTASATTANIGQQVTLSWNVSNAVKVVTSYEGTIATATSGATNSHSFTASSPATYTISAYNSAGNVAVRSLTVNVASGWQYCSMEGSVCYLSSYQNTWVRYGANGKYLYKHTTGAVGCNNGFFGGDPIPGVLKHCDIGIAPVRNVTCTSGTANWAMSISFDGLVQLYYGEVNNYTFWNSDSTSATFSSGYNSGGSYDIITFPLSAFTGSASFTVFDQNDYGDGTYTCK